MSREFGSNEQGFLHDQIRTAAEDLEGGRLATTRAWAPLVKEMYPVMYAIASAEACDSDEATAILASMEVTPQLRAALDELEQYLYPYRAVAREAVRRET